MPMTVKHMFGALAVSAAAAMLAACGQGPVQDPSAVAPQVLPQPTLPVAADDQSLTASTDFYISHGGIGHDVPVKGVKACQNVAMEHTYRSRTNTRTSCTGDNGQTFARFYCSVDDSRITCKPF